nr:MAG TPA: tail sheath protein [Caudoviricetes sp.]
MALGGGTWLFQNKKLPGTYINFVSRVRASTDIADRGFATMPLELDWGPVGNVFAVTVEDFQERSLSIFGYDYTAPELKGLRDLFLNLKTGYFYRLDNGAAAAACAIAKAKYPGKRGNDITVSVTANVDHTSAFDVTTYILVDGAPAKVDEQKNVSAWADVQDNDYVTWIRTGNLEAKAGEKLTGGSNGAAVTGLQYQSYLDAIEPYYFNIMGYAGSDATIQQLLIQFTKRMREATGAKFQLVLHGRENVDYEGVISLKNAVRDEGAQPGAAVYWLTGAEASCAVNASCTNKTYDGEYRINTKYSQTELERAMVSGMLMFHNVADSVSGDVVGRTNILSDINTLTSFTKHKNEDFGLNQVIRVLDQIAIDVARLFNRTYLGKEQNDEDGRIALWGDIVALHKEYQRVRAIQNFDPKDVPIPTQGEKKTDVLMNYAVQPTCCMERLYMSIEVA